MQTRLSPGASCRSPLRVHDSKPLRPETVSVPCGRRARLSVVPFHFDCPRHASAGRGRAKSRWGSGRSAGGRRAGRPGAGRRSPRRPSPFLITPPALSEERVEGSEGERGGSPFPPPPWREKTHIRTRPQIRRDDPLNLSILLSGGKETNKDSLSSGERRGKSPAPNPPSPGGRGEMWRTEVRIARRGPGA